MNVSSLVQALNMLVTEADPIQFLLSADEQSTESIYSLQANTAQAGEAETTIAYKNVVCGEKLLQHDMDAITSAANSKASASDKQMAIQEATTIYGGDSQLVSNTNDSFNTVSQTVSTGVSDLTRQAATAMDSASSVVDNLSALTNMIGAWASA